MSIENQQNLIAEKGLVICNIGAGKGKTTAAFGTCIRASGAGMNVHIIQFVKARKRDDVDRREEGEWPLSAEIEFLNAITIPDGFGKITNEQVGLGFVGILGDTKEKEVHVEAARKGLERAKEVLLSRKYEVVFLDEIISALEVGLISEDDIVEVIKVKPEKVHLIITGHNKYEKILELCDMVTKMEMLQHPYYKGILAQRGIDY